MPTRRDVLERAALEFHKECPEVWALFVRFAEQAKKAGYSSFGAKAVWERLRWEAMVNPRFRLMDDFRLNNNHHAFYARWYNDKVGYDFFRTRTQVSERRR